MILPRAVGAPTDGKLSVGHQPCGLVTLGHPLRQRVLLRVQAGDTFAITVPAITETLYGIGLLPRGTQNLAEWARLRPSLACYIPYEVDAENAATLQRALRRQGWSNFDCRLPEIGTLAPPSGV
jgi:hypothetical protein